MALRPSVDSGTGRQPSKSEDLLFDRATGELIARAGYPTSSRGFKIRRWLRFAHSGEVYRVIGQSIAGIVCLCVAAMVWTGLAMSWRRFFGSPRPHVTPMHAGQRRDEPREHLTGERPHSPPQV